MDNKQIDSRIVHKHDLEANWVKAVNFVPMQGEIIVYDIDDTYDYERIKVGDGVTVVSSLPFTNDALKDYVDAEVDALKEDYYGLIEQNGSIVAANSLSGTGISAISDITAMQDGSGDPSPDNVRVITGWDAVSVTRTGRNLLSHMDYEQTSGHAATNVTEDAIDVTSPTTYDYGRMPVHLKAGVTYTLVIDWEVYGRDESSTAATYLSYRITALETAANQVTVTANGVKRVVKTYTPDVDVSTNLVLNPNYGSKLAAASRTQVMLLVGAYTTSTAPAFEPCSRQALAAELPETVFGGTLDWLTGVLTVDKLMLTYDGTEDWAKVTSTQGDTYFRIGAVQDKRMSAIRTESSHSKYQFSCSHFLHITYGLANKPDNCAFMFVGGSGKTLAIIDASFEDVDSWKAYLAEQAAADTPLTCVFDLGTPRTIQLDPQMLTAIDGINYAWSDCGDICATFNHTPFLDIVNNKVDKVEGMGLSSNDYTTDEKDKLADIEDGATKTVIDSELSSTSTNPVQNKVISTAIDNLNTLVGDDSVSSQISNAIANKSDVGHTHTADEVGADPSGSAESALSEAKSYTDTKISDLINSAPTTLDTLGEIATAMEENADVVEALDSAIGTKVNVDSFNAHINDVTNPHDVTLSQLGVAATAAELDYLSGATSNIQAQLNNLSDLVGDTAVSEQISGAVSNVTPDTIGALDIDDYYGIVRKEGDVVSAESLDGLAIGVVSNITAVQSGTGDPSPDNVRPISGWDTVQLWHGTAYDETAEATLTVSLPEIVYGGTLDWNTGVLTVDKFALTYDGSEGWDIVTSSSGITYCRLGSTTDKRMAAIRQEATQSAYRCSCSHYLNVSYGMSNKPDCCSYMFTGGKGKTLAIIDSAYTDVTDWTTYLAEQAAAGTPLTCVYSLGTPYTIQFDPQQLTAIDGANYVWSNCGDSCVTFNYTPLSDTSAQEIDDLHTTVTDLQEQLNNYMNSHTHNQVQDYASQNALYMIVSATEPASPTEGVLWFDIS